MFGVVVVEGRLEQGLKALGIFASSALAVAG